MKAITLTQPWASLVAIGAKRIETRSWATKYRGPLAIHAGVGLGPVGGRRGLFEQCYHRDFLPALEPAMTGTRTIAGHEVPHINPDFLPRGAIVAVARLAYCVPTVTIENGAHPGFGKPGSAWPLTDQERAFGDYSIGRYGWLLADVRRLPEPVPCKGALGLWDVPADVAPLLER